MRFKTLTNLAISNANIPPMKANVSPVSKLWDVALAKTRIVKGNVDKLGILKQIAIN